MKPGYKTTEFWLTLLAQMVALLMASGAFAADSPVLKVATYVAAVLAQLGYVASRAMVKNTAAKLELK